ncbi:hypothetical protein GCM10017687_20540 [Streptomyces echinatus]|uniref:GNAT family N-acetyltransferase n=1 Tax=Streptomyces echinatus TaxID=67293 RepID=UPI0031F05668
MADYRGLDPFAGRATVGITIGERDLWGAGHGGEALSLLLDHLFGACRLHRVELETWSGKRACPAGVPPSRLRRGGAPPGGRTGGRGQWYDEVLFGLLREEWEAAR